MEIFRVAACVYRLEKGARLKNMYSVKARGFKRIITFETGFAEMFENGPDEYERAAEFGIELIQMPWSNVFPPTKRQKNYLIGVLKNSMIQQKDTILHCYSNVDRTGAASLITRCHFLNWDFEESYEEFVALGRHWWFGWWKPFLRRLC